MFITVIKDNESKDVLGIISSYETTSEEIEDIAYMVKRKYPYDWTMQNIKEALPRDCTFISDFEDLYI